MAHLPHWMNAEICSYVMEIAADGREKSCLRISARHAAKRSAWTLAPLLAFARSVGVERPSDLAIM